MIEKKTSGRRRWYVLVHQLPPEPLYLRAKIRQRLTRVGAVALKNAVYVLPRREDCLEDFQWIAEEARTGGGDAYVCEAEFLAATVDSDLIRRFRGERDEDYTALADEIREWKREAGPELASRAARARKRLEEIGRIDFFQAPGRRETEKLVAALESLSRKPGGTGKPRSDLVGRTWATRRGVHIDRISSAWLVRRFIDPRARFRFIDPKEPPGPGEVRFDIVGGDFSHEGDRCTFETLVFRTGLDDAALRAVGEIVHDIDLKDEKFGRSEAAGIERMLSGLILSHPEDEARLEHGFVFFDQLYQSFRKKTPVIAKEVPK